MTNQSLPRMRETLLEVIAKQSPKSSIDSSLFTQNVLSETSDRLELFKSSKDSQQALLTLLHDLFRTGYLAWGNDINNPDPPRFHVTNKGRTLLENISRDPGNPDGYMNYLKNNFYLNDITFSYIEEAIQCYVNGLYKATAVMTGAAAESLILEIRNSLKDYLFKTGQNTNKKLDHWMITKVHTEISDILLKLKDKFPNSLYEELLAHWPAFIIQIRKSRNESGHPSSVSPSSVETVYASLLIFPELVKLEQNLLKQIKSFSE